MISAPDDNNLIECWGTQPRELAIAARIRCATMPVIGAPIDLDHEPPR
jgi:hypothetical protein